MYGIIPAAPPPDQSYEPAPRGVGVRTDGAVGSFADQLARVNSTASERSSHNEATRGNSASEEQRQDAQRAATRSASGSDEAESRVHTAKDEASRKESDPATDHSDTSAVDKEAAARTEAAEDSSAKKRTADVDDQTDDPHLHSGVHAPLKEQKDTGRTGTPEAHDGAKDAAQDSKKATSVGKDAGVEESRPEKATLKRGTLSSDSSHGPKRGVAAKGAAVEGSAARATKSSHIGDEPPAGETERAASRETEKATAHEADLRTDKQKSADSTSGKIPHAESSLVERAERPDDTDRNRRVRTGQDARDRRIAADKAGTRTVEAKAVSPVDAENTHTEKTVTREMTVDLSEGTRPQAEANEGADNSLSAGRIEVGLRETTSRPPSISQATQTLARRLNGELGDSIVRQAKVMLQDANHAELRLVIRPPELGRIRIRLQMDNGHIAGRILVDNGSVREVVEQNLASLQRAFEEAGLEMGDLEVSTGDAREDTDQGGQDQNGSGQRSATAGAESFGRSIETISEYEPGRHRINLVA